MAPQPSTYRGISMDVFCLGSRPRCWSAPPVDQRSGEWRFGVHEGRGGTEGDDLGNPVNLRERVLPVGDGDRGNGCRPQALANEAVHHAQSRGPAELGSECLHEFEDSPPKFALLPIRRSWRSSRSIVDCQRSRSWRCACCRPGPRADQAEVIGEWDTAVHPPSRGNSATFC
jgi:hypothetical protein